MLDMLILRLKLFITFLRKKTKYDLGPLGRKNIFVFLGADYGNLGDVAITYAQVKYLKEQNPDYNVIEIPISRTLPGIKAVRQIIGDNDIVSLIGGGNTSDLYDDIEFFRQMVIWCFRRQKIVAFPQTFHFTNSSRGRFCKYIVKWVYKSANALTVMAREQNTMNMLMEDFPKIKSMMLPDVVMTLDERKACEQHGVLVCMRSDKEKSVADEVKKKLFAKLESCYGCVDYQDTEMEGVDAKNRYEKLRDFIQTVRMHELVITDRLHGMIFCFITATPALVLDNSTHKISSCYEWIKECGYIKMIRDIEDIETFVPEFHFEKVHNSIVDRFNRVLCQEFL